MHVQKSVDWKETNFIFLTNANFSITNPSKLEQPRKSVAVQRLGIYNNDMKDFVNEGKTQMNKINFLNKILDLYRQRPSVFSALYEKKFQIVYPTKIDISFIGHYLKFTTTFKRFTI